MGGEDLKALAGLHIPHPNGLVEGTGDDDVGLRVEVDAEHVVGVTVEGLYEGPSGNVPEAEGLVVGGGDKEPRVGGEGEVGDALLVTLVLLHRRQAKAVGVGVGVREAVGAEGLVGGGRRQKTPVGGELHRRDGTLVTA